MCWLVDAVSPKSLFDEKIKIEQKDDAIRTGGGELVLHFLMKKVGTSPAWKE